MTEVIGKMSDEYIKMILALPDEFFEGWEWHAGDQAINVLNNRTLVFLWKTETYAWYYNYHPSFSNEVSSSIKLCEIRPIPSQEQLQNLMKLPPVVYIEDLYEYANEPLEEDMDPTIFDSDMKCFTLAYVMDRKYGKYWNGDSWEKMK